MRQQNENPGVQQNFRSKMRLIFSYLGTVVGTGNIWRFPRIVANNSSEGGCLVFVLVWLLFMFLWAIPVVIIEYATGRYTKKGVVLSFKQMLGEKSCWCGAWITMVSFFISCYYSVVVGWCLYYMIICMVYSLPSDAAESREIFVQFTQHSKWSLMTHGITTVAAGLSVTKGVTSIENVNLVLVPILLIIILFTFVWSLTRPYADQGILFLISPSWETLKSPQLWIDAISQNAFDTGAGWGTLIPYSTFMTKDNGIVRYGALITIGNNFVSFISGMTLFIMAFSSMILSLPFVTHVDIVKILQDSGPANTGLVFIWVPVLFSLLGHFGRLLSVVFFLCLFFAGLTSLLSNVEMSVRTVCDFGVPRKYSCVLITVLTFLVGVPSALDVKILTNQDFVWSYALIINGLMILIMVISFGASKFRSELINKFSTDDWHLPKAWEWAIKYLCPIEVIGLILWWIVNLMIKKSPSEKFWYEFGYDTLVTVFTQWVVLMALLILITVTVIVCRPSIYWPWVDTRRELPAASVENAR